MSRSANNEYGIGAMDTDDMTDMKTGTAFDASNIQKPKRVSRTYAFSDRDIRKYEMYKKEGRLRFPDLFLYHINRPTDDVQREAKLAKKLEEEKSDGLNNNNTNTSTMNTLTMDRLSANSTPSPTDGNVTENVLLGTQQQPIISKKNISNGKNNEEQTVTATTTSKISCAHVITRVAIPAISATAGFVGTLLITSSIVTSTFIAIPCAVVAYGTVECIRYVSSSSSSNTATGESLSAPIQDNDSTQQGPNQQSSSTHGNTVKMEALKIST
jgi:hypothetical protein